MEFTFTPKSEAQIQADQKAALEKFLWPAGDYPYAILEAKTRVSAEKFHPDGTYKSGGKPMIELKLNLFRDDGTVQQIYDYLMGDSFEFKLRHAAYASGLGADYESGKLNPADFKDKTGIAKVIIRPAKGDYGARNAIDDYVVDAASSAQATAAKTAKAQASGDFELNDEIGF